mmetsp:Transcript_6724/g.13036  ORF Transcript_6724/g.13036 Transcript_6724/m.13036 type:complete len:89 (+) Transcript_6724:383-649(+)
MAHIVYVGCVRMVLPVPLGDFELAIGKPCLSCVAEIVVGAFVCSRTALNCPPQDICRVRVIIHVSLLQSIDAETISSHPPNLGWIGPC